MTGEELDRTINFLLESQAKLVAQVAETDRQIAETDRQIAETGRQIAETNRQLVETNRQLQVYAETQSQFIEVATRTLQGLAVSQEQAQKRIETLENIGVQTDARLAELAAAQAHAEQLRAQTDARLADLAAAQARGVELRAQTDARLDRIAALIERHVADGHGG